MKSYCAAAVITACLGLNGLATAASLQGTVKNGTTGKPAEGKEVALLSAASRVAMGHARTDARGRFSFAVGGAPASYLVRVVHQGVSYDKLAPAGANPIVILVYDAARKLDGVAATVGTQRFESQGNMLRVVEQTVVRNVSNPPRTLINGRFEVQLPAEAQVESGLVQSAGGQPLTRKPIHAGRTGRYYLDFPLRPGETRFAVAYRLPYKGEAAIEPKLLYPLKQFAVVVPKSMKFEPATPDLFQPVRGETRANVYVTAAVKAGQPLAFRVSGAGALASGAGPTPAGGTGPKRADPMHDDRWIYLGGFALVLGAGVAGLWSHQRKRTKGNHLGPRSSRLQGGAAHLKA